MAIAYKVLGQSFPSAATLTTAYTVPASTEAIISSIVVCNQSTTTTTSFRVAILPGGGTVAPTDYVYYNVSIADTDTFIATIGATLEAASIVQVYAALATLSFNIYGSEITA